MPQDDEILTKLDGFFRSALDHPAWMDWRTNAIRCFDYYDGKQWTEEELRILAERHQPPTVNNQVKVTVNRMLGQFVQARTRLSFRGRNAPADEPTGQVLDELFRHISQMNQLSFQEQDCFQDGIISGFGAFGVWIEFDDLDNPIIRIEDVDPFEVYPDPHSRKYDWNEDAAWVSRSKWYPFADLKERYPDKADELTNLGLEEPTNTEDFALRNYVDFDGEGNPIRVRAVETWYRIYQKETIFIVSDAIGGTMKLTSQTLDQMPEKQRSFLLRKGGREIVRTKQTLNCGVHTAGILLDHKVNPHRHPFYPYIPFFVERQKNGEPFGPVRPALPMQDAVNKRESKALHLINTKQVIYRKGMIKDATKLAEELARPDGQIEVELPLENMVIHQNIEVAQSQFLLHNEAKQDFRRITGINPESLGERSEVRSGVGIARKQAAADLIVSPAFANFARTRQILGKTVLAFISSYYDQPTIFMVTDDQNRVKQVALGPDNIQSIKTGIYDVVVEEVPDTTTMQQEQQQMLLQLLPQIVPLGGAWVTLMLEMSSLKGKEDIIQRIQQMSTPPPPQPKYSLNIQWDVLTPEEKLAFAGQLGLEALARAQDEGYGADASQNIKREIELSREMIRAGSMGQVAKIQAVAKDRDSRRKQEMKEAEKETKEEAS